MQVKLLFSIQTNRMPTCFFSHAFTNVSVRFCFFLGPSNLFDAGLIYATKAPTKISIILSKETRCLGDFRLGRPPPTHTHKAPKNKSRKFGLRMRVVLVYFRLTERFFESSTVARNGKDNLKQFLRRYKV